MINDTYPTWLYKPVDVPNLKEIQQELIPVLEKEVPNYTQIPNKFAYVLRDKIEPYAPLYTQFINSLGLLDRWHYSAFIMVSNGNLFPIHVDSLNWQTRCYGLNLPLVNCEDSYTVFYDAEIDSSEITERNNPTNSARVIKDDTIAVEIGRWDASKPAWINIRIPHNPVANHNNPRVLISARFRPEIHDILYK